MANIDFVESLKLRQVSPDEFQNVHEPWTWRNSTVIPGGLLMSECAAAAYHTVPKDFVVDSLQTHFLSGPSPKIPMTFKVNRLSNGRRFVVRNVTIEQNGTIMLTATLTFVNAAPWTGPAMIHAVLRETPHTVDEITLDDLEPGRSRLGSFMKFQRLPLVHEVPSPAAEKGIATSAAQIIPPIEDSSDTINHLLGIINLSDYHIMDAALQLSDIPFGLPKIGDISRTPTKDNTKIGTTLNHSIHFHVHNGFRADELTYIETRTPWARDGRAMLNTRIFGKNGVLIATCVQEAFYVLKPEVSTRTNSKL